MIGLAFLLVLIWIIAVVVKFTVGGLIHILLAIAIIAFVASLLGK